MRKEDQIKADFIKSAKIQPSENIAAYYAFVSATLTVEMYNKVFRDETLNNNSVFDNVNSPFK